MTSVWAQNFIDSGLDRDYYLEVTKEGHPMQRQVPQTYQVYAGTGGETLTLDGSNRVVIDDGLAGGPLILDASENQNLHGRVVHILITQTLESALTLSYPNGEIHTPGTETTAQVMVFPAGQTPVHLVCDFYGLEDCFLYRTSESPAPPIHLPAVLNYRVLGEPTNIYDGDPTIITDENVADYRIAFDPDYRDSTNSTTVTYDEVEKGFTIHTVGYYHLILNSSLRGNLDRCVRISMVIDYGGLGTTFGATWGNTAAGLINQNLALSWAGPLSPGDIIYITSHYEPLIGAPASGTYGLMTGQNTQNTTACNFIQIIQL